MFEIDPIIIAGSSLLCLLRFVSLAGLVTNVLFGNGHFDSLI